MGLFLLLVTEQVLGSYQDIKAYLRAKLGMVCWILRMMILKLKTSLTIYLI